MPLHPHRRSARRLINMNLLDRLSRRILDPSSDRMVEDDDFLHTLDAFAKHVFHFDIVSTPHLRIICEALLLGWRVVDGEAGVIRCEVLLSPTNVVDGTFVVAQFEGATRTVNFGPWFACIGGRVDVLEGCGRHGCSVDGRDS